MLGINIEGFFLKSYAIPFFTQAAQNLLGIVCVIIII